MSASSHSPSFPWRWPHAISRILALALALAAARPADAAQSLSPPAIAAMVQALKQADGQGIATPDLAALEQDLKSQDQATAEQARARLVGRVLAYARAEHGLRTSQAQWPKAWGLRPAAYDAQAALSEALAQGRLGAWLSALAPSTQAYEQLVAAYARYRALAAAGGWPTDLKPLRLGDRGPAAAALRRRLAAEDPAVPPAAAGDAVFDAGLKLAVARAQARFGLEQDGAVGRRTLAALNVSARARADQIQANMERLRWAPRGPQPDKRVEVNIADASLRLFTPGQPPLDMKVIVGQPKKPTPMFTDQISAVVLNPPWNVPPDIARAEIWPKIRRDPGYATREGFVVRSNGELQQLPGPRCALGTIKFDLSNPYGVYLHDTPARSLFAQPNRALSHGCMRVEKPNLLAKTLLAGSSQWTPDAIDLAIAAGKTVRIGLTKPIAVTSIYATAFVADDGTVNFRDDVYGWDAKLLALLGGAANR